MMKRREGFVALKEAAVKAEVAAEYIAFIDGEIAKIDARNSKVAAKRAEKTEALGEAIRAKAIEVLAEAGRAITLAELVAGVGETAGKVAYYIRPLVAEGAIVKAKAKVGDRKIMTYAAAEAEAAE